MIEKLNVPAIQSLARSEKTDEHQKDKKKEGEECPLQTPHTSRNASQVA